jgi:hypothetical protein
MKTCNRCKETKELTGYYKASANKDGHMNICIDCRKEFNIKNKDKISNSRKKKYAETPEKYIESAKRYYLEHTEKIKTKKHEKYLETVDEKKEYNKSYYISHSDIMKVARREYYSNNREEQKQWMRDYRSNNKEVISETKKKTYHKHYNKIRFRAKIYDKMKMQTDPYYKFKKRLRTRIRNAMRLLSTKGKIMSCIEYGIDFPAIFAKIGEPTKTRFHLDHIIPLDAFDLDNPEHVRLAHLPVNLQWLTCEENLSKARKILPIVFNNPELLEIWNTIRVNNPNVENC